MIPFHDPTTGTELHKNAGRWEAPGGSPAYPVAGGVARFLPDLDEDTRQVQRVFDYEHARHERSHWVRFRPELIDEFLADCELPRGFFADKDVLDAGCGSGRWSYALSELGAHVHSMDLTAAGPEALSAEIGSRSDVRICQADLYAPPFPAAAFDFVISWGVLHHTRSTRRGFASVARLVKPGGMLYVMVYPPAPYLQGPGTDLLRAGMRRLSDEQRYKACRHLVIHNRYLAFALGGVLMVAYYDPKNPNQEIDPETMQFGLFDAYSPRWNHRHGSAEVVSWFRDEGFREVTVVDPGTGNVRVRGQRPA
jgi:SAM-dependent methyltransferase